MTARLRRPVLRLPRHRATTAHCSSLYPWGVQAGLGHRGVYIGTDLLSGGGAFIWDIFDTYHHLSGTGGPTNTNAVVMGEPGQGKSALIKSYLYRQWAVYGPRRQVAIVDVKGEYGDLAAAMGMPVIRLAPGGTTRINPLDAAPTATDTVGEDRTRRRAGMVAALVSTVLDRRLTPLEDLAMWTAVELLDHHDGPSTLADLAALLTAPTADMAAAARTEPEMLATEIRDVAYAIERLLSRDLRGMFDGPTTTTIDPTGPGLVVDLSAVLAASEAVPLVMVAATGWLQELFLSTAERRQRIQVLDESWRMVAHEATARYLQSCWKLGRSYGIANMAILHRPSDLAAQTADGTATAKIASGLLADTGTVVVLQQSDQELTRSAELLGFSPTERELVAHLVRGRALWRVGGHGAVVHHHIGPGEGMLCDTDQMLRTTTDDQLPTR